MQFERNKIPERRVSISLPSMLSMPIKIDTKLHIQTSKILSRLSSELKEVNLKKKKLKQKQRAAKKKIER
jgi:hypothetical protein